MTNHSPLAQFEVYSLYDINFMGQNLSITNSSLIMFIALAIILIIFHFTTGNLTIIPNKYQVMIETMVNFIKNLINDCIERKKGERYFSLIFTVFIFILCLNLLGMVPYSFTVTSHIIVTFALAITLFIFINIIAFANHGIGFLKFFLPSGTPLLLAPLMIIIEIFTYLSRPISLSIRLAANMVAGHVLLKVIAGYVISLGIFGLLPVPFIVLFEGFEIFVALLQAYIFTILLCVYLNDALNLH